MLRLHRDSSRSYPGRPARLGVVSYDSALHGNMQGDRARSQQRPYQAWKLPFLTVWWLETSLVNNKSWEVSFCRRAKLKLWGIVHTCSVAR